MKYIKALKRVVLILTFLALATLSAYAADKKYIALTFDDGPGPYTDELLDILKAKNVHATFFVLGSRLEGYKDTVKRICDEGHQLAMHGFDHADMKRQSNSAIEWELGETRRLLNEITGRQADYVFRPPYGSYDGRVLAAANIPSICWTIDTMDWSHRNTQKTYEAVVKGAFDGAIALQHDIHISSVKAVGSIIDTLKDAGYEMLTVDEMFWKRGTELKAGSNYSYCPRPELHTEESSLKLSDGSLIRDIAGSDWYSGFAAQVIEANIMELDEGLFYARRTVSRGDVIEALYRLAGSPKYELHASFSDIPEGSVFFNASSWAAAKGISKGFPDRSFRPDERVTRQDFAVLYYRYAQSAEFATGETASLEAYKDRDSVAAYAEESMAYMVGNGLISGLGNGMLSPGSGLSRAQLAAVMARSIRQEADER